MPSGQPSDVFTIPACCPLVTPRALDSSRCLFFFFFFFPFPTLSHLVNRLRLRLFSLATVGDIFLLLSSSSPSPALFCLRPIMLYQIPWPLEQSRRWIRYMPLLNVNNRSLTSTSEWDACSLMHLYTQTCYKIRPRHCVGLVLTSH